MDTFFEEMEVPLAFQTSLRHMLAQPTLLEQYIDDKHVVDIIADICNTKWFHVQGSEAVVSTRKGVCPGDPLADLLFNIAILPVLNDIRSGIVGAQNCRHRVPWP